AASTMTGWPAVPGINAVADQPIKRAPAAAAAVPHGVIAPEVPWGTLRQVVINRGGARLQRPNSVAHVSAVAAAMAPAAAPNAMGEPVRPWMAAAQAATPPLAAT